MREFIFGEDFGPYDPELIQEMYIKRICGIPISFYLLDLRKTNSLCHLCSNTLSLIIPGSNRVTGNLPEIKGNNKGHSWVEKDDIVYDTTKGLMYRKSSYYERTTPTDITIISREQTEAELAEYLKYTENQKEMYIAFVKDLENSLPTHIYRKYLKIHIDNFKKEKNLDVKDYNEDLVNQYLQDLQSTYQSSKTNTQPEDFEH